MAAGEVTPPKGAVWLNFGRKLMTQRVLCNGNQTHQYFGGRNQHFVCAEQSAGVISYAWYIWLERYVSLTCRLVSSESGSFDETTRLDSHSLSVVW